MALTAAQLWKAEILWWLLTLLVVAGVLLPIYLYAPGYPFFGLNALYIVGFITLTRYTFLLRFTFVARRQTLKLALIFLSIPLVFLLVQELNLFQTFFDEEGQEALLGVPLGRADLRMVRYVHSEMLLFGTGCIIAAVVFPLRLVLSVWRTRNRGTV